LNGGKCRHLGFDDMKTDERYAIYEMAKKSGYPDTLRQYMDVYGPEKGIMLYLDKVALDAFFEEI